MWGKLENVAASGKLFGWMPELLVANNPASAAVTLACLVLLS